MLYFVYRGRDKRWLGTVEAGSAPEAAGQAQRAYGGQADEGGLLVSVLPEVDPIVWTKNERSFATPSRAVVA